MNQRSLANLKPFKKGRSGNPTGGPKGPSLIAQLRRMADEPGPDGKLNRDVLLQSLWKDLRSRSPKVRMAARAELLDRLEGKAIARQERGEPGEFERALVEIERIDGRDRKPA